MLWNIIVWIIVGALAGWIASKIMARDASMGAIANIIVGIIGAFVGGWIISLFGIDVNTGTLTLGSVLTAILGAVVLLAIVNFFTRGRAR
ncbi:MAG: GlsB/YeaQ/YmgE family stress response membrane protein [Eubacteriales bacterium]|nr:GlsB/YeaQ/YmgE family stress response membrane protein [Eubacteriales bacterium]MDD4324610.1 GlsB/YeaQ/YmgE family stress response membrane protein [Eubacteriales bacterium]